MLHIQIKCITFKRKYLFVAGNETVVYYFELETLRDAARGGGSSYGYFKFEFKSTAISEKLIDDENDVSERHVFVRERASRKMDGGNWGLNRT